MYNMRRPLVEASGLQGVSPIERLFDWLNIYIDEHQVSLTELQRLVDSTKHPVAQFLVRRVAASKTGDRGLLMQIAATLRDALHWTHSPDARPRADDGLDAKTREAASVLRALVSTERALERDARKLAKACAGINGGLDALLLETIAMDSQKHEYVLRFTLRLLELSAQAPEGERGLPSENRAAHPLIEQAVGLIREPIRAPRTAPVPLRDEPDWRRRA